MSWLGIIAFLCLGGFIAIVINSAGKAKGKILQQDFIKMGNLVGLSLAEIKAKVGEPNGMSACKVADTGENGTLYTWAQNPYSITLLFDENNKCLGVNQEIVLK
jgi:hypothetical protein